MLGYDCHAHVYENINETLGSNYHPSRAAPLAEWKSHLNNCQLRGGVLVQPSFLGFDNSQLLQSLHVLGAGYKGVAQLPRTVSLEEMQRLDSVGITGVRWNMIEHRCTLPDLKDPEWIGFLDKLHELHWHLEIHLEEDRLPAIFPTLCKHGVTIVIDHFGLPQHKNPLACEGFRSILEAGQEGRTWIKLSAPYRSPVSSLKSHIDALMAHVGSQRMVWGSDWPWTRHENKHTFQDTYNWLKTWTPDVSDYENIIDHSPRELYRLKQ
jgi:predicted TIM-barrel fold metal-dependent hydrolase